MLHMRSHLAPSKFSLIYCSCTASYPKLLSDFLLKYAISKHCCCFYCITNSYTSIIAASSKFSLLFPTVANVCTFAETRKNKLRIRSVVPFCCPHKITRH